MLRTSRREFLAEVGRGMLTVGIGSSLCRELGLTHAEAGDVPTPLDFGPIEPLAALLQETPPDKLLPILVERLKAGEGLRRLVAAGALANARSFGGHDYNGYHSFMALMPALHMSEQEPQNRKALPVLKVLYRNATHIQSADRREMGSLEVEHETAGTNEHGKETLREAVLKKNLAAAERKLAQAAAKSPKAAFDSLLESVQDDIDVHRIVLAWRAWDTLQLTGREHALTLLRQSVRFCIDSETMREKLNRGAPEIRADLPKLIDQHRLAGANMGTHRAEDGWIDHLARTVYQSDRRQAADAVAAAIAEGFAVGDIAEAINLAANSLVLHDPGRARAEPGKPVGSVHGASLGVHASDAANAWRNVATVSTGRNAIAALIVGAYHTAGQTKYAIDKPYPWAEHVDAAAAINPNRLLDEAESAIHAGNQGLAAAMVQRCGQLGMEPEPVFTLLRRFAVSEDGALHAEKYYRTVCEEFTASRPAFRWRHLTALARVTASQAGNPAPGIDQAKSLLGA